APSDPSDYAYEHEHEKEPAGETLNPRPWTLVTIPQLPQQFCDFLRDFLWSSVVGVHGQMGSGSIKGSALLEDFLDLLEKRLPAGQGRALGAVSDAGGQGVGMRGEPDHPPRCAQGFDVLGPNHHAAA